jgi:hypothetical protein
MINAFHNNMKNTSTFGYYKTKTEAEAATEELKNIGINQADIAVLYPEYKHKSFTKEELRRIKKRALLGAIIVFCLFVIINFLVLFKFLPSNLLPAEKENFGSFFIAHGFLKIILAGGFIGALIGALSGLRSPKGTQSSGKDVSSGDILISVHLTNPQEEDSIKDVFRKTGASDIDSAKKNEDWENKILPLT